MNKFIDLKPFKKLFNIIALLFAPFIVLGIIMETIDFINRDYSKDGFLFLISIIPLILLAIVIKLIIYLIKPTKPSLESSSK